jgi:hypothetical protein
VGCLFGSPESTAYEDLVGPGLPSVNEQRLYDLRVVWSFEKEGITSLAGNPDELGDRIF